jgi:hypothetical protein
MRKILLTAWSLLVLSATAWPQPNVGNPAPNFSTNTLANGAQTLVQYRGKVVYLFFLGYN